MIGAGAKLPGTAPARSAAVRLLTAPLPLGLAPTTIVRREFRNALSGAAALAMLHAALLLGLEILASYRGRGGGLAAGALFSLGPGAAAAALLLGAICGADEEETGTAAFCRQLPISALRILAEKIAGSALAFIAWAILCGSAVLTILYVYEIDLLFAELDKLIARPESREDLTRMLAWAGLFLFSGLAAGIWIRRVIPAAVVGGIVPIAAHLMLAAADGGKAYIANYYLLAGLVLAALGSAFLRGDASGIALPVYSTGSIFGRGLFWKEWRAKRWTLALAAGVVIVLPVFARAMIDGTPVLSAGIRIGRIQLIAGSLILSAGIMGSIFFTAEERDPSRSLLFNLPLTRAAILRPKLAALAFQYFLLCAAAFIGAAFVPKIAPDRPFLVLSAGAAAAAPAMMLAAILSLHLRSALVTLVIWAALAIPMLFVLALQFILSFPEEPDLQYGSLFFNCAFASAALAAWLFFVVCKTPLLEAGWGVRLAAAFLTGIIASEFFATVLYCDWRDLAFLLFGV